jgi:hypothetical protein
MSREEIQKLLGGYATNTLTVEEQQALFAAALEDQELFDALGREQSLRDLLGDPAARAQLLAALDGPAPAPWLRRWWRPLSAAAAAVALASVAIVAMVAVRRHSPAAAPAMVAKLEPQVSAPPAQAPAPAAAETRPVSGNSVMARQKKSPPASVQPPAAASAPPPAAPQNKAEFAASAGAQTVQAQASASIITPAAVSLSRAQDVRNLPAATRNAVTTGVIATLKTSAAPADARALFYGAGIVGGGGRGGAVGGIAAGFRPVAEPAANVSPGGHLGIQYRVLRKADSGEFVETGAAATGSVAAGTLFKLQITANGGGYVRILQEAADGAWQEILNHAVEGMQPIETEPIEVEQPGRVKFYLAFARQPLPRSNVAQPDDDIVVDRGRVVTVAGRDAAAQRLAFNITLTIQ